MAKRSLADSAKDPLAKANEIAGFIQGEERAKPETKPGKVEQEKVTHKMFNTRLDKDLIKRLKLYSVQVERTIQDIANDAVREKLEAEGY